MNKLYNIAKYGLILIFSLTIVFHLLVLTGIIPFNIVWGGRLKDHSAMLKFESVSILLNVVFLLVVLIKTNYIKLKVPVAVITSLLWMMVFMFTINTIGNLFATHSLETIIFTPITAMLSAFSLVLILKKES